MTTDQAQSGMLAGLSHPHLLHAIVEMHEQPAHDWSLEALSCRSGRRGATSSMPCSHLRSRVGGPPGGAFQDHRGRLRGQVTYENAHFAGTFKNGRGVARLNLSLAYDDQAVLAIPSVRLATPGDARAIAELSRDSIERGLGWSYSPSRIQRAIRSRTTNVAVVHERGCLLAFGIMDYGDTAAHLVLLGVQPQQRRRGLGRHVLSWLEQCAVTAGLERIGIEVRADNPGAIGFYRRLGYEVRGRVPGYYRGVVDAVVLEKRIGKADDGGGG